MEKQEKDAFELDDEAFNNLRNNIDTEEPTAEESTDDSTGGEDLENENEDGNSSVNFSIEDFSDDRSLEQDEEDKDKAPDTSVSTGQDVKPDSEFTNIVHNGKLHRVSHNDLVKLAQQGFDYTQKTSAIAPHRRLIELIEGDETLKEKINRHVTDKLVSDVAPREDYESEDDWMKANISKTLTKVQPFYETPEAPPTPAANTAPGVPPIVAKLKARDPENFDKMVPYFGKASQQLTKAQYDEISNDEEKIIRFYDEVKKQVTTHQQKLKSTPLKKKQFNLKSGQGNSTPMSNAKKNVWELPNKEFEKIRQKSLGY